SVALRAYADLKHAKGGSQIPFYQLSAYGGRSLGRGFENLRYRGNNLALFSGEIRRTLFTMEEDKGFDVIGFVDGGQVWGDNRSKVNPLILQNDRFRDENYRIGGGGGIQYRFSKGAAFRVEAGASNERALIYFGVSRGF